MRSAHKFAEEIEFVASVVVVFHGCWARLDVFDKWSGHFSSHEGLRLGFCMGNSFFGSRLIFGDLMSDLFYRFYAKRSTKGS